MFLFKDFGFSVSDLYVVRTNYYLFLSLSAWDLYFLPFNDSSTLTGRPVPTVATGSSMSPSMIFWIKAASSSLTAAANPKPPFTLAREGCLLGLSDSCRISWCPSCLLLPELGDCVGAGKESLFKPAAATTFCELAAGSPSASTLAYNAWELILTPAIRLARAINYPLRSSFSRICL